ncbi:MAG: hypothetical protein AAGA96_05705 [Verrucomicrobiota bacterium]
MTQTDIHQVAQIPDGRGIVPAKQKALRTLREQLGKQVTSASQLLDEQQHRGTRWSSGREDWDAWLGGGWARGQLTEMMAPAVTSGSGLVMAQLLRQARLENRYVALLDVGCGFSTESIPTSDLETLLWIGCRSVAEAMEVLDVASRDENFHLFMVDLRNSDPSDFRSIKANQWYRILGQLRQRESVAILFARHRVTAATKYRYELVERFSLESLEKERHAILCQVSWRPAVAGEWQGDQRSGTTRLVSVEEALRAG